VALGFPISALWTNTVKLSNTPFTTGFYTVSLTPPVLIHKSSILFYNPLGKLISFYVQLLYCLTTLFLLFHPTPETPLFLLFGPTPETPLFLLFGLILKHLYSYCFTQLLKHLYSYCLAQLLKHPYSYCLAYSWNTPILIVWPTPETSLFFSLPSLLSNFQDLMVK
jgi:hypothetical protein